MMTAHLTLAQLRLYWDCRQRRVLRLTPGELLFGSSARADVQLPDRTISGLHFTVSAQDDGRCFLRDLNSRNGTRVNGQPVRGRVELASGDLVQAGYVTVIVLLADELQES